MDLATFLEARIADDEAAARTVHDVAKCDAMLYEEDMAAYAARTPGCDCGYPARVLREVDAKRKIVAEHAMEPGMLPPSCVRCCDTNTAQYPQRWDALTWPCPTVRALAAVWSDHKDYDLAWKGITDG